METLNRTTEQIITNHIKTIRDRSLESMMEDYHDDAILITPTDVFSGKEALRAFFEWTLENLFTADGHFALHKQVVEDDLAYIIWEAKSSTLNVSTASDTFLIRDGKISRQTAFVVVNP